MNCALLALTILCADPTSATVRSENFTVTAPSVAVAERILENAEEMRREIAIAWCGNEIPAGTGRTVIHVQQTTDRDRGRTALAEDPDRPKSHLVWLQTDDPTGTAFEATLKHELTHCILATRYPGQLPVWIHEGCAGQCDIGERSRLHEQTVAQFAHHDRWPDVTALLDARHMDANDRESYGATVSLARYLLNRGGRARFLAFGLDGPTHGWNTALHTHYGLDNTATLQHHWQHWATTTQSPTQTALNTPRPVDLNP